MNKRLIGLAEQLLLALAVFSLVLLIFDDKLVVPDWLQPVGRMHPLLLHFPIVILLLAFLLELFRFSPANAGRELYGSFLTNLLLIGAVSAGLTVVMGLFLAQEGGYTGPALRWHKWLGASLFGLACLFYWARKQFWYNRSLARAGALTTTLCLIGAGHYGATLTHGDNFVLAPLTANRSAQPVALDKAQVFTHVVQPIFEQKCVSCHNADKLKGELMLTDAAAVQKGGKSGALFRPGQPDSSLLLQRIELPLAEKKHMPPLGKAQLTPQEIRLLALWVNSRPDFHKKVIDLPPSDSLRIAATHFLTPAQPVDTYAFDAADDETIRALNNDYRRIVPLARESPALAVNLYNKSTYSGEKLAELKPIADQVVYLNLNKLPVNDADLKPVGSFQHLEKLDLNFTDITGAGLAQLSPLTNLTHLAVAGTRVTYADLQKLLPAFKHLQTVAVWQTALTPTDVATLRKRYPAVTFISGFDARSSQPIRLNPPQLSGSPIFSQQLVPALKHPVRGVQLRYTTDGTDPDSLTSPVFSASTVIRQNTTIKTRAFKEGWYGSNVATFDFYKRAYQPDSVRLLFPLSPVHQAEGARSYFDGKLGTFNANSPAWANNWTGFRQHEMALVAMFDKPVNVSSVTLRTLIESENIIFPPASIEVWGGTSPDDLRQLGTTRPAQPTAEAKPVIQAFECHFKPQSVTYLKIVAKPLPKIPAWHSQKDKTALLLVDEVFLN